MHVLLKFFKIIKCDVILEHVYSIIKDSLAKHTGRLPTLSYFR
jgi:hypothetical protein